jgi:hypothetical protein
MLLFCRPAVIPLERHERLSATDLQGNFAGSPLENSAGGVQSAPGSITLREEI